MSNKISELEISENKDNDPKASEMSTVSLKDRVKQLFNNITVEPYLLCYLLPMVISGIAAQKFNLIKACRVDLGYSESICENVVNGNVSDNITDQASNEAQRLVADMYAWAQPLQTGLPAFIILFIGAWSDKTGNRKALMIIPILGEIISSFGLCLATYFLLEWPLWVTGLIEALPSALSGSFAVAFMGSTSYVADVTTVESRTLRMGVVSLIVSVGFPLGIALGGYLTEVLGFLPMFIVVTVLFATGFIYTCFYIKDVRRQPLQGTIWSKLTQFFNFEIFLSFFNLFRGKKLLRVILLICAYIDIMGPIFGGASLKFLYALKKFGMTNAGFSLFTTYSQVIGMAGTTIVIVIFSKYLKMHDTLLGVIISISKILGNFFFALAPNVGWFYVAPIIDMFGNAGGLVAKSFGTKIVEAHEIGKICSLLGFVESVSPVIYTPLFSKVYSMTVKTLPEAFFYLGGVMTVPGLLAFLALYFLHKRDERDVVKNPEAKEEHAHENSVTVL
ncbi:proton-coupled folate transporter-like isoform X2 [Pieris napi]|uniref:proton-coupled folate transporter-like isoform X2 n=1 Tax=Pieris napi TaxID=78633 RepID=UPI001FBB9F0E|nr:proton-coupled folate transporter-like isoform X2 [Pieris napi]